ncbi:MAG: histidine phosphatase family protein [Ilumatobacteraceae bacterium]
MARTIGGHRTCSGLSPLGVRQSEALRDRWTAAPEFTPDLVIASEFRELARPPRSCPVRSMPRTSSPSPASTSTTPGGCDGMSMADFVDRYGTGSWEEDPFGVTFRGETIAAFHFRVGSTVRRITDEHAGATIVVFCHGGVIDSVLRLALRAAPTGVFNINTLNTSITELELVKPHHWALRRYGGTAHLHGLPVATNVED